ncbi:hypothetical protein [Streptomyces deccanensis]|uniref:hypothetical protein n=1 Tax=Streptomyces deccanensis TaxID=424188 RepID=UPI001EFB3439|nr:hypothetical protein [Streptomyces deccanensis]ULR48479.1 hypothetical protein L3078_03870 [Streptomyces deccanensis]
MIRSDLALILNQLADRHDSHPGRSTYAGQMPAIERERSAMCACPPMPRTLPAPPLSMAAGPRR